MKRFKIVHSNARRRTEAGEFYRLSAVFEANDHREAEAKFHAEYETGGGKETWHELPPAAIGMTENVILELAGQHGLKVNRRIVTGTEKAGFAQFEIPGNETELWPLLSLLRELGPCSMQWVDNPEHPDYGKPFIFIDSVWVEE